MSRATRKASITIWGAKRRVLKMWTCCWKGHMFWWCRTRLRYFRSSPQPLLKRHNSGIPRDQHERLEQEKCTLVEENQVREHLNKVNIHKALSPKGMHHWVLRELADVVVRPPSIFPSLASDGSHISIQNKSHHRLLTVDQCSLYSISLASSWRVALHCFTLRDMWTFMVRHYVGKILHE